MQPLHRRRRAAGALVVGAIGVLAVAGSLASCSSTGPAATPSTTVPITPRPTGTVASFGSSTTSSTSTTVVTTSSSSTTTTTTMASTTTAAPTTSAATTVPATTVAPVAHSVFLLGDSVMALLEISGGARNILRGYAPFVLDAKECRRMNGPSCALGGKPAPTPGINVLQGSKSRMGDTVVIMVGYNELIGPKTIDNVMNIVGSSRRVLWLTYRNAAGHNFGGPNGNLAAAARRWPNLHIADWNGYSAGRGGWFASDGLHLTSDGANNLARFIVAQLRNLDASGNGGTGVTAAPTTVAAATTTTARGATTTSTTNPVAI